MVNLNTTTKRTRKKVFDEGMKARILNQLNLKNQDYIQQDPTTSILKGLTNKTDGYYVGVWGSISPKLSGYISPKLKGDISGFKGLLSHRLHGKASNFVGDVTDINGDLEDIEILLRENQQFLDNEEEQAV